MQLAHPDLTPFTFEQGLFRAPPPAVGRPPRSPPTGTRVARRPSYSSPADYTFIWYDATAKGPDEEGVDGTGLMQYVDGGHRYRAGTVPDGPVAMFSTAGAVRSSDASPPDRPPPTRPGRGPRPQAGNARSTSQLSEVSGVSTGQRRPLAAFANRPSPLKLSAVTQLTHSARSPP